MILLADIGQTTWLILWLVMLTDLFTGWPRHPENQETAAATVDGTRDVNITTAGDAWSHFYKRDSSAASLPSVDQPLSSWGRENGGWWRARVSGECWAWACWNKDKHTGAYIYLYMEKPRVWFLRLKAFKWPWCLTGEPDWTPGN